jgi:two-component system LytT family response regulator
MNSQYIHIGGRLEVCPQEVVLLQADVNYTIVHFSNGKKTIVATPLKTLESRFSQCNFYRTHKSFLVNINCVKKYLEASHTVQITDSKRLDVPRVTVSRRKISGLKRCLLNV